MTTKVATHHRVKRRQRKTSVWPRARLVTTVLFLLLIAGNVWTGTTCALDLGAVEIACPLGVIQLMAAARRVFPALLLGGLLSLLPIAIFGRAFCSWICPGRWIFNRGPSRASEPGRASAWVQRALVGGVVGAAWICHTPVFCVICPAGVMCRGAIAAGTGGSLLPTIGWLGTVVGLEWASGRSWCHALCPLGALFSRLSRYNPFFRVAADANRCVPCKACAAACPEGLSLANDCQLSSCTKCLDCIPACPRDAIALKVLQSPAGPYHSRTP